MKLNIEKLEKERARLGIKSKRQFCTVLGISPQRYNALQSFESTTLKTINQIAEKLGLDPKDLLT